MAYTSQTYAEAMVMRPAVSYITYATSSGEQTGDIIAFAHFEEGNIWSEIHNDTEISNKYDDD